MKSYVIFVINGEAVPIEVLPPWASLSTARWLGLNDSGNTGRPPEEWEVRTEAGRLLDPETRIEDLDQNNTYLFLSLRVGIGGAFLRAA